jgi:hypothetical protein
MDSLIRVLNDEDREALVWLRKHAGDQRVAAAARRLSPPGKRPLVSAVCRYLGVWPPAPRRAPRAFNSLVADRHLAQIRELLAQRSATKLRA